MPNENRKVKSYRVKPSIIEKMDVIKNHLSLDTNWWNENNHTKKLGYWRKGKVTSADVLEIAVSNLFDTLFDDKK